MTVPSHRARVAVACDKPTYRKSIAAIAEQLPEIALLGDRPEGEEGAAYVRRVQPDVVILGIDPQEDWAPHLRMYLEAFDGPLVGFAFDGRQHEAYRAHGIETVDGRATGSDLARAVTRARRRGHRPDSGKLAAD
ncbi:MAG: hypothetical protein WD270_04990 [Acetobacterales bacterium]